MLILHSIPLSFSILWRYLLVLPFMLVALLIFGALAGVLAVILSLISPLLGAVVIFSISFASSTVPILVGTRLGLQAKGVIAKNGYGNLLLPAIGYGAIEVIAMFFIALVAILLFFALSPNGAAQFVSLAENRSIDTLAQLGTSDGLIVAALLLLVAVLFCAFRGALLVPLAAVSVGMDANGRPHTPFAGFGKSLGSLLAVVALGYVGFVVLCIAIPPVAIALGMGEALEHTGQMVEGTRKFRPGLQEIGIMAGFLLISFWMLSLQCAGGVLAYLRLRDGSDPQMAETSPAKPAPFEVPAAFSSRMSADELRALRKSRQGG